MRSVAAPLSALVAAVVAVSVPRLAAAQPGQTPPAQPGQPAPGGGWNAPPGWGAPQAQRPTNYHLLTPEERQLLFEGEISDERHIVGGLVSVFVGWGLGQAVQGRFDDTGWIFLVGEGASLVGLVVGFARCASYHAECSDGDVTLVIASALALGVFRVWEVVDAFAGPGMHNREVRRVRAKAYGVQSAPQWSFHVLPTSSEGSLSGATAGFSLRF